MAMPYFVGVILFALPYLNNKVVIDLDYRPHLENENNYFDVNVQETGTGFEDITISYTYGLNLENTKGIIHFGRLPDTFKIYPKNNLNCTLITNPFNSMVFHYNGSCYIKHFPPDNGCILAKIEFSIRATTFFGHAYDDRIYLFYPEAGKYWFALDSPYGKCIRILSKNDICAPDISCVSESNLNMSNLIYLFNVTSKEFNYPPAYCSRGILPQEYCIKRGFKDNTHATFIWVTPNKNMTYNPYPR